MGSDVGQIFRQRAYIGITRSRMRWYVRKNYLKWVKTMEIQIWCAKIFIIIIYYDVASGSEIKPYFNIDKPLVVYRFLVNVMK